MKMIKAIESLHPGNFAMVMATGIIAIAMQTLQLSIIADVFAVIAFAAWLLLLVLCSVRLYKYPKAIKDDLLSAKMVFSYFTFVAATDIIGILAHYYGMLTFAIICWFVAFTFWCLLLYLAFSVLTFISHENNVNIMHGGWLITIVGTQSLVLLGVKIAPSFSEYAHYMMLEAHMLWGLGLCLYGIFVTLFCYRIFFLKLKPQDVTPLLWVVMGAAAISANAGTSLLEVNYQVPFLESQKPFVNGITLMMWSWATWWIPLLFLFGVWKHLVTRLPFSYEPTIWSMVFPLGMYTLASARLGILAEFPPMYWIANIMLFIALLAWLYAIVGMLAKLKSI